MGKFLAADRMAGFVLPVSLGALASGATNTDQEVARFVAPHDMKLEAAFAMFISALTGAATNNIRFAINNVSTDGDGTTELAYLDFEGTAVTADVMEAVAFTLTSTAADLLISAGDAISIAAVHQGTGEAYPIGNFTAHFSLQ
jgi:hypothetical protein